MTAPWEWADRPPVWGKGRREPPKLSRLRHKLHQKAKQEPKFRFYTLYNHVLRQDVLETAWAQVRRNDGAPGVDGVTIDQIVNSEDGSAHLIEQLQQELREKTYKAQAIRRTYIDKQDGGQRPLGIPTVRDRVVQMAAYSLIVDIDATQAGSDYQQLTPAIERIEQSMQRAPEQIVVDGGYISSNNIAEMAKRGIDFGGPESENKAAEANRRKSYKHHGRECGIRGVEVCLRCGDQHVCVPAGQATYATTPSTKVMARCAIDIRRRSKTARRVRPKISAILVRSAAARSSGANPCPT